MKKIIAAISVFLIVSSFAQSSLAQSSDVVKVNEAARANSFGIRPALSPAGLLDFSKVRFEHSYSMSYFSGGGVGTSHGLLRSTMYYDFSPSLSLALNLGVLHNTGGLFGLKSGMQGSTILPGFSLNWRPSEKVLMSLSFQRFGGGITPYDYRGRLSPFDTE